MGIEAYARRKGHRDTTLSVDVEKGKPIVTLQGRRADEVVAWFRSHSHEALHRVDVVG